MENGERVSDFKSIDADRTESVSLRLDIDITPRLADLWAARLRRTLIDHIGDVTDAEGWDANTAGLPALVARSFDRQFSPIAELHSIIDEHDDLFEDYVWFGQALDSNTTTTTERTTTDG